MKANDQALKTFLFKNMYRHYKVNRMLTKAKRVVAELFQLFLSEPGVLPTAWGQLCGEAGSRETARVVSDYIAGMTDAFFHRTYQQMLGVTPRSV
jgi:dGTPase